MLRDGGEWCLGDGRGDEECAEPKSASHCGPQAENGRCTCPQAGEGEVLLHIKVTGICGYEYTFNTCANLGFIDRSIGLIYTSGEQVQLKLNGGWRLYLRP